MKTWMIQPYADRAEAGRALAQALTRYANRDAIVLALPRGGVPVAEPVAKALDARLDVLVVRKLGVPGHEEYAMGALASGDVRVLNHEAMEYARVDQATLDQVIAREKDELDRRERAYRGTRPPLDVAGKVVIIVDDGLATGSTMRAAIEAVRARGAARVIAAVPVGSPETCDELHEHADDVVCAATPEPFLAVGAWYDDFSATTDEEVRAILGAPVEMR